MEDRKSKGTRGTTEDARRVVQALSNLCDRLNPGDQVPTHTELMRTLCSSERFVRRALDELVREGRIVRRSGAGTFVAEPKKEKAPTIVAIARPDRSFFDCFLDVTFRRAEEAGLNLVCQPIESVESTPWLAVPMARPPLGYILFSYTLVNLAARLQAAGNRVIVIGAPPTDTEPDLPCIFNDHAQGGYLCTRHLIDLGHRRIVFCRAGAPSLVHHRRWRGHLKALAEAEREGVHIPAELLLEEEIARWADDPAQARAYFASLGAPTAIVSWNDHEAAKLLATLARAGIQVPREVSLVGHDNLPESEIIYPALTTIDHDLAGQATAAIEFLTRREHAAPPHIVTVPKLVVRESTSAPPHPEKEEK